MAGSGCPPFAVNDDKFAKLGKLKSEHGAERARCANFAGDWIAAPAPRYEIDRLATPSIIHVMPVPIDGVNTVTIRIRCAATGTDVVFFSVGAFWCGPGASMPDGLESNWSIRWIDTGEMELSVGGQGYATTRPRVRELSGSWAPLSFVHAIGPRPSVWSAAEIAAFIGTTTPCIFIPRQSDADGAASAWVTRKLAIYGYFTDTGSITHLGGNNFSWGPFTFRELL